MSRFRPSLLLLTAIIAVGCATTPPRAPRTHYETACEAYLDGDAKTAAREAKLALQEDPLSAEAHFILASLLVQQGEPDQAIVGFRRASILDPVHPTAAYNLGTMLLQRNEVVPAARLFEASLLSHPDHVPSLNNLGKAYFLANLPELAIACYEEALRHDPSSHIALTNQATLRRAASLDEWANPVSRVPPRATRLPDEPSDDKALPGSEETTDKEEPTREGMDDESIGIEELRELVRDLPYVTVEQRADWATFTGWTRDPAERAQLDTILAELKGVLDLTTDDSGDSQQMIEVDATIFIVIAIDATNTGFNFLRLIDFTFDTFVANHQTDGIGFAAPGVIDQVSNSKQAGFIFSASVDYDVNIANAVDERVAVLARPHLTALSGTSASFLAGGEIVFRVAGNISGDIKPYPFGTTLEVAPTLLRTPGVNGGRRVRLKVSAGRSSILDLLAQSEANLDSSTIFDKVNISAEAVLDTNRTLILSGLNQKERRTGHSGVPILRSIPLLRYFFSTTTNTEVDTSVIILLTPRDPAFQDERNRKALEEFVKKRRSLVAARAGTDDDFRRFTERYPDWRKLPPNRFASHFFLLTNSELYRAVSGDDLTEEDLALDILGAEQRH